MNDYVQLLVVQTMTLYGTGICSVPQAVLPLRILIAREFYPDKWRRLDTLMDHIEDRRTHQPQKWEYVEANVVDFILGSKGID